MNETPIKIIGSYASPYVRKVLVCLGMKGVQYEIDPIVPFYGNDEFARLSPLRRIPVLIDGSVSIADSTVICEYLDEKYPAPALLPRSLADRAQSRWLEEFADTRMGDVFIWKLFNQLVIKRAVWNERADDGLVREALERDIPDVLGYLEKMCPESGYMFGSIGICDIALATFFRNAEFARWKIDAARWPRAASYVERTLSHECFAQLRPYEDVCTRTPVAQHRAGLIAIGAPIAAESVGNDLPQRGVMRGP